MTSPKKISIDHPEIYLTAMPCGFKWIDSNSGFFALYSEKTEQFRLNIYDSELILMSQTEILANPSYREIAWIALSDLPSSFAYSWQVLRGARWSPEFSDPLHPWLAGQHRWRQGCIDSTDHRDESRSFPPRFDLSWVDKDATLARTTSLKPRLPWGSLKIYECHVRSATLDHPDVQPHLQGTLEALPKILDHVEAMGFNAIELMPLHEFNELLPTAQGSEQKINYWGYMPLHLMAIMRGYSAKGTSVGAEQALVQFIDEAHKRGIEVLLDIVFNHIDAVENQNLIQTLPTLGFHRGADLQLIDYSGCGNTLQLQHPPLQGQLLHILREFATRLGLDGFRFDLAGAFARVENGSCNPMAPFLQQLTQDPWLKNLKLIAEPWDAAGAWLVSQMAPLGFYEWNDRYRDDLRHFLHFSEDKALAATRLCGSSDIYGALGSPHAIHYITCHDGFSLRDLVSYNERHNEGNGEEGRDGHQNNLSFNHGVEGPTDRFEVIELRERQIRNFILALAVTQGPIMINSGDEYGHSRMGNNNPWCQDNQLNALNWQTIEASGPLMEYWQQLMRWRTQFGLPEAGRFYSARDCIWYSSEAKPADWSREKGLLYFELRSDKASALVAFNSSSEALTLKLPKPAPQGQEVAMNSSKKAACKRAGWTLTASNFLLPSSLSELSHVTLPAKSSFLLSS